METETESPSMKLIEGLQAHCGDWDIDALGALFGRLRGEVPNTGDLTRYVGYECVIDKEPLARFLGVEVGQIEAIPDGLVAWDLRENTWTMSESAGGLNGIVWQGSLTWQWSKESLRGGLVGEFCRAVPRAMEQRQDNRPFGIPHHLKRLLPSGEVRRR